MISAIRSASSRGSPAGESGAKMPASELLTVSIMASSRLANVYVQTARTFYQDYTGSLKWGQ